MTFVTPTINLQLAVHPKKDCNIFSSSFLGYFTSNRPIPTFVRCSVQNQMISWKKQPKMDACYETSTKIRKETSTDDGILMTKTTKGTQPTLATLSKMEKDNVFFYLLNGEWRTSSTGKVCKEHSPCNGTEIYTYQSCSSEDANQAFHAAAASQVMWAKTPLWKRAEYLKQAAIILRSHQDEIANSLMNEIAKNRKNAISEVVRTADLIEYVAEEGMRLSGKLMYPDSFPGQKRNQLCLIHRVPLGVVLCIPPFNYPVNLCASKVAPALMMGNSVVIKTPSHGVISCLYLAAAFHLAGIPRGVVNVLTGKGSEIGDYLVTHPLVNAISLTGGTHTGLSVSKKAGMIPLQMELGGKDAAIVVCDADLQQSISSIASGAFSYNGQRCTAVKIVYVVKQVADALVDGLKEQVEKLSVGSPQDNADITPVVHHSSADYIEKLVQDAIQKGAKQVTPFKRKDNLIWPTILDHVDKNMRVAWEEPFGPLLPIVRVDSEVQAIEMVNKSPMGLQASIFSRNMENAMFLADFLKTGTIHLNGQPARGPDHFPFQV
ncbi:NADP-dependent glyceraldehyde-3-phosphate dehydrogenase [Galdieria sulphuraria]|nr:NADP-dependent glyceraldehyde-3-phosphate dehydrogenase [Galdieria sulphuraria]